MSPTMTRNSAILASGIAVTTAIALIVVSLRQRNESRRKQDDVHSATRNVDPNQGDSKESEDNGPVSEILIGQSDDQNDHRRVLSHGTITIVHASVTGTCAKFAEQLKASMEQALPADQYTIEVGKVDEWDWWDELLNDDSSQSVQKGKQRRQRVPKLILLIPTYTGGTWPSTADAIKSAFNDLQNDWRIQKFPLKNKLQVAVFGLGSSAYADGSMGKPAKEAQMWLHNLGAKTLTKLAIGDNSVGDHASETFGKFSNTLISRIIRHDSAKGQSKKTLASQQKKSNENPPTAAEEGQSVRGADDSDAESTGKDTPEAGVLDLEDLGEAMTETPSPTDGPLEMVTPSQATALKKEGYKLIGTHSAVKLCRWTKHQLRGRGGCYKHTFYGITSYQCMEATPSLACANKCVFCWRHHKNPVGKEWRWKTDDPFNIVDEAVKTHVRMIKETKGIPGVQMSRWEEAHTVRHCALSLVGEPIMYPRIDELLGELHRRKISTFLVTNGQHPQAIQSIRPITQLYVSVDASTPESLIEIDRPLFQDAWERLNESLVCLKEKGQRTVARLTVVKGWNSDEIAGYAKLVALGRVSLVEVKGVTFSGKSDASNLNMSNTPWHHEIVAFVQTLKGELDKLRTGDTSLPDYEIACEHRHSCSVLLARVDQFAYDDPITGNRRWKTWIDYDKFNELSMKNAENPSFTFDVKDYVADTPEWALFGAEEEGFDPVDVRHRKQTKNPKYVKFDDRGVPTHDHNNNELSTEERLRLSKLMDQKINAIGSGSTVTEFKDGSKEIQDASLMFRGMVITKG